MPTRRQFLFSAAATAAAAAVSYRLWQGLNRPPVLRVRRIGLPSAHLLRDGALPLEPVSEHRCSTLILGSGAAGLSAAWYLAKHGRRDFLLADGFERNGNNAAARFGGLPAPTGAHYLALPSAESTEVREMLSDFGILSGCGRNGEAVYRETDLVHAPEERLFYQGAWHEGLLRSDGDSRRFLAQVAHLAQARGSDGRKIFAIPIAESSQDGRYREWDGQTFAQWLARQGYRSPTLLWYLDYCCRDDYGAGAAQVSAFAGLHYFAARANRHHTVLTWPDGLNHLSQQLRRHSGLSDLPALPDSREWHFRQPACCDAAALSLEEQADGVRVLLRDNRSGKTVAVTAKKVVCAMPLTVAARLVAQPQRYGFRQPVPSAPWLVSNFLLKRFPNEPSGSEQAWDNVVYGTRGLGWVVATHQNIYTAKPSHTVFTAYTALNHDTPTNIRRWLLHAADEELLAHAAADLLAVYGRRFWRHTLEVDIAVRAHAMSIPLPGYLSRADLTALRQHRSRILFAHSDLSGYSVFEEAAYWGVRAARQLLAA